MDLKRIAGPVKAAILIHALGRSQVENLTRRLSENEKELVNDHIQTGQGTRWKKQPK
jgi:flagellar motor switch protein FliG